MTAGAAADVQILHVDDPDIAGATAERLERERERFAVVTASTASEALGVLETGDVDCVVSEYDIPESDGLALLERVREEHPDMPFVLVTDEGSEELASEAISAGVSEYLRRQRLDGQYDELAACIEREVAGRRAGGPASESDRMLSRLIENLPGMVYRCRNERGWPMEYVSEGCEELTGHPAADLERGTVEWGEDVIHPDDREEMWAEVQRAIDRDEPFEVTYRITTRDGEVRWCWERGSGVFEDGDLVALEGFITDITEQRRHEQELEQYRTLVENVADPMYILDADGEIVVSNSAMADHLGYDHEEILGKSPAAFMPPEDVERGLAVVRDLLSEEGTGGWRTWEMDVVRADGTRFRNETKTAIIYDEDGEFAGSVGVLRDITDRKEREAELERFETIIEAVGDPVYVTDEAGRFEFINDAIADLAGHAPADLKGEHVSVILDEEDVETGEQAIRELLKNRAKDAAKFEAEIETVDGGCIPCELHIALLPTEDAEFRGTAGVIRDIEARKEREQRLEEFASVVSHDLRGPLNVILGRAALARESDDLEHVAAIEDAAERMDVLIENLLTLARQGDTVGTFETTRLGTIAAQAWSSVDAPEATLESEGALSLQADPRRLQELLENLFRNALEHGGDDVTVTVGTLDDREGFFVADDGPGIPEADREQIFEHGYTTSDGGTGFGLSIVQRIAEAHDWRVVVTDSDGGGARFEVRV